jgi:hypothetical protein
MFTFKELCGDRRADGARSDDDDSHAAMPAPRNPGRVRTGNVS